jgi:4'-phosphopantetheinyl transferase
MRSGADTDLHDKEVAGPKPMAKPRHRFAISHGLLRRAAAWNTGDDPSRLQIARGCPCGRNHGKPTLTGNRAFVSDSKSGTEVVVAACSDCSIGVDVQTPTSKQVADELSLSVLTTNEQSWLANRADVGTAFAQLWTRKEAALKCTGIGMTADLTAFCTFSETCHAPPWFGRDDLA